jgi:hypothetical protein
LRMRDTKENAWMRWWIGWRVFACLMVLLVGAVVMFAGPLAPGDAARFWSAWTAFALWTAAAFWIPRDRLIARVSWSLAYFVVGWGLWIVMLGVHPVAYALAGVLFPYVSVLLRMRWAIPATIVQVGVMVFNPEGGAGVSPKTLVLFAVIAGPSVMLMLFIDSVIRQSEERKRWIGTLEAAQRDLARSERRAGSLPL